MLDQVVTIYVWKPPLQTEINATHWWILIDIISDLQYTLWWKHSMKKKKTHFFNICTEFWFTGHRSLSFVCMPTNNNCSILATSLGPYALYFTCFLVTASLPTKFSYARLLSSSFSFPIFFSQYAQYFVCPFHLANNAPWHYWMKWIANGETMCHVLHCIIAIWGQFKRKSNGDEIWFSLLLWLLVIERRSNRFFFHYTCLCFALLWWCAARIDGD